jgi:uncharacterized protein (DUF1499 family)
VEPLEIPLVFDVDEADVDVLEIARSVCDALPGSNFVVHEGDYIRFEFRSRVFRFVDDVELLWDPIRRELHFRSASRAGHSDMGVNRRRVDEIKRRLSIELTSSSVK